MSAPQDSDITPTMAAAVFARAGIKIFPVDMRPDDNGQPRKEPLHRYRWKQRATANLAEVVEDFTAAEQDIGIANVGIAWAVGQDGCFALDLDGSEPEWWADLGETAVNTTKRGRHLIYRMPQGRRIGNGTSRFPTQGWGEVRGDGGYIIIWWSDRPGFDAADLAKVIHCRHPEWLTDSDHDAEAVTFAELDAFVASHTAGHVAKVEGFSTALAGRAQGASRHDHAVTVACWIAREAAAGLVPAADAFAVLEQWWAQVAGVAELDTAGRAKTRQLGLREVRSIECWAIGQLTDERVAQVRAKADADKAAYQQAEQERLAQMFNASQPAPPAQQPAAAAAAPVTLAESHDVCRRWFGDDYDFDAWDVVLAVAACEQLTGDPAWLLIVGGSGNAKTETVQAIRDVPGVIVTSSLTSPAALLSGTPAKSKARHATGGLLRRLGDRGILVIKDVTSILSMDRNARGDVMSGLREIHDGYWERNIGTDGGLSLSWTGRIVLIGAVTTAWDQAHAVIAAMGDRFVLLRLDLSNSGRRAVGRRSIGNTGGEVAMRADLAAAAAGVLAGIDTAPGDLTADEIDLLVDAADLVTRTRTAVEADYHGNPTEPHALEAPTRFAKELAQIVRGAMAIGCPRDEAMRLALRCARDSMPALRLAVVTDLAAHPASTPWAVARRLDRSDTTVRRCIEQLWMLGVARPSDRGNDGKVWSLTEVVQLRVLGERL